MYRLCQRDGGGYHKSSSGREGLPSVDEVARVMRRMRGRGGYSDLAGEFDLVCSGGQRSSKGECEKRKQVSTEQGKEAT